MPHPLWYQFSNIYSLVKNYSDLHLNRNSLQIAKKTLDIIKSTPDFLDSDNLFISIAKVNAEVLSRKKTFDFSLFKMKL